jgi:hypothetical protein
MPNLIPPADWQDAIPKHEERPDMIDTPRGSIGWDYYLTGKEGFVGRDNIVSGGMYFPDGRPLIQTSDLVNQNYDIIHHKELKAINKFFEDKKIPETLEIAQLKLEVVSKDEKSELYFQGKDEEGNIWTFFKTYKCLILGIVREPEVELKSIRTAMLRVVDFFLINQY